MSAATFDTETPAAWRADALDLYHQLVRRPADLAQLVGRADLDLAATHRHVLGRLTGAAVEDVRIDFEDGYGARSDSEEDDDAARAGAIVGEAAARAELLRYGLRCKPFEEATVERAVRTIDRFVASMDGARPDRFVVTLPKVSEPRQVELLAEVVTELERMRDWHAGTIMIELQIELPSAVINSHGTIALPGLITAADGRCIGLHYGTYDFAAAVGLSPDRQSLDHPLAHVAKTIIQLVGASHHVDVVDGSTNLVPVGSSGECRVVVQEQVRLVLDGLQRGLYQGWDIHPRQLVGRWIGVVSFYLAGVGHALNRLSQERAAVESAHLEEPASLRALEEFLRGAIRCDVLDPAVAVNEPT